MKLIYYSDKNQAVKLGDFVECRSMFLFWQQQQGRVSYLPGVSKLKKSMEANGIQWLGITLANGSFISKLIYPETNTLNKRVKFISRTDGSQIINPLDITQNPITISLTEKLNTIKRSTAVAQIGEFRADNSSDKSRFSGNVLMQPDEKWPSSNGQPMQALLQINLSELPIIPDKLSPYKLITVFIDADNLPTDTANGDGWLVKTYNTTDKLTLRKNPITDSAIKSFEISWSKNDNDFPNLEDASQIIELDEFATLDDHNEIYYNEFDTVPTTKVGGFPNLIQASLAMKLEDFVFQIATEDKVNWTWGDAGTGYFGLDDNGSWKMEWQCY